jgi:hypothetical protein
MPPPTSTLMTLSQLPQHPCHHHSPGRTHCHQSQWHCQCRPGSS